eukprot:SAG31_NODE_4236_length_3427_cov_24.184574_3_plen_133_part_00
MVLWDESLSINVMVKCSASTARKPARYNTREEVDLHALGGPGGAHVGGRADLGVAGSRIAAVQVDRQVTGLGRSKRSASGIQKVDECQPGHGVLDGVDDDDAVEDWWYEVVVIAAEHEEQNKPAPQNERMRD